VLVEKIARIARQFEFLQFFKDGRGHVKKKIPKVTEWIQFFENHVKSVTNECRLFDLPSIWYNGFSWTVPASSDQLGVHPATPIEGNPTTVATFWVEDIFSVLDVHGSHCAPS
jgi:hypothetical protein